MRIEIDISAANDPDAHAHLDTIIYMIENGWHVWDTTTILHPDVFETTTWLSGDRLKSRRVNDLLKKSIARNIWGYAPHGRCVSVTACPSTDDDLNPRTAARLAIDPLCILVENRDSDGAFVKRILRELDESLYSMWERDKKSIRFDSLGGKGQMVQEVQSREKEVPYRPRLVAIIDSDKRAPVDSVSREARRLRRTCQKLGIACWVLAKREAENYLPRVLLDRWPNVGADHRRLVNAWDRLTDDQKDFFDFKQGLPDNPTPDEEVLFDDMSPIDRDILSRGFGQIAHKLWNDYEISVKRELQTRGRGDLEHGISLIHTEV